MKSILERITDKPASLFPSGRQALLASIKTLGLPVGSRIVVQTYVCDAVVWAIREAGLSPKFCDIGPAWVSTPATVAAVFDRGCTAIVLAPPFGIFQSAKPFRTFGVPIIHDLCQAAPQSIASVSRAHCGDMAILSFHPTKYAGGGGGAALDLDGRYTQSLAESAVLGNESAPFNELQAAINFVQLGRLKAFEMQRATIYDFYMREMPTRLTRSLELARNVETGTIFRFPLRLQHNKAEDYFASFASRGVAVRHGVDSLAHRRDGLPDSGFACAVRALDETLSVPFYPSLSGSDAETIVMSVVELL